jgi:urea transporter/murein DD-endopeptidase MepM/ murein hydrolase activator NlpD
MQNPNEKKSSLFNLIADGFIHSYAQIFFSLNKPFGLVILLSTLIDPKVGLLGALAVILTNLLAYFSGFSLQAIREGLYGFNSLLLGLGLSEHFQWNTPFALLFLVAILLNLILTVWLHGALSKHQLPFLSFPFLFTFWMVCLASQKLTAVHPSLEGINFWQEHVPRLFLWLSHPDGWPIAEGLVVYWKTLAGTFFQNNLISGILISIGLWFFSRIAFSLSLIGFFLAYFFYRFLGADVSDLNQHLMGSNFIFLAIGIGCFYLIPNIFSYLSAILLTPILVLMMVFFGQVMSVFGLQAYTLAFSVAAVTFLYFLRLRWNHKGLHLVEIQYYHAEKTVYKHVTFQARFSAAIATKIFLPFWGKWRVSQGYNGNITHLGDWAKALDFDVVDDEGHTYQRGGLIKEDYFCYNKPVLAPADGYVHSIVNTIDDNNISDVNLEENWGNTIILHHLNGFYSQLSHLKKDTFKTSVGEYVRQGQVLAMCGNSGRSPEPHIHFQLQGEPKVGAKTVAHPIAYYMEHASSGVSLRMNQVPKEQQTISNVEESALLKEAFDWIPGKSVTYTWMENEISRTPETWEVFTDAWNRTYFWCAQTQSTAYFVNDGTMFFFTDFEGKQDSLLFAFYLAFQRVLLAYYPNVVIKDEVPLIHFQPNATRWLQDLVAPFYLFTRAEFRQWAGEADNPIQPSRLFLNTEINVRVFSRQMERIHSEGEFMDGALNSFTLNTSQTCIRALRSS